MVVMVMRELGKLDADPRDYVVLNGSALLTVFGEYWVTSKFDGRDVNPINVEGDGKIEPGHSPVLIHRKELWRVVGVNEARRFWRFGHRTRR